MVIYVPAGLEFPPSGARNRKTILKRLFQNFLQINSKNNMTKNENSFLFLEEFRENNFQHGLTLQTCYKYIFINMIYFSS